MNFTIENARTGISKNNISVGLPVHAQIRPVCPLEIGAGVLTTISLSVVNSGFEKKVEAGDSLSLDIDVCGTFISDTMYLILVW